MGRESGAARIEEYLGPAGAAYGIIKPIVEFLANPLDAVTGDPEQLRAKAEAWRKAADEVEGFAQREQTARQDLLSYWEGAAAQAFNTELAEINQSLKEMATHFDSTAELLDNSAEGAQQAQELVEDIVKELIIWLIGTILIALASSWITLGASVAAGAAAGAIEAGVAGTRAAQVALKLANLLRKVAAFLKRMSDFAKAYKITSIRSVGVSKWMGARFATSEGYQLIATNWVLKQPLNPAISAGVNAVAD
jgi:WXG100 family type VII secretion target